MADETVTDPVAPALPELAAAIVAELVNPAVLEKLRKSQQEAALEQGKALGELAWKTLPVSVEKLAATIIEWTSLPPVVGAGLARAATDTLLGEGGVARGESPEIGRRIISKLGGVGEAMAPGIEGASAYLGLLIGEQVEAWARGVFAELVSGLAPAFLGVAGGVESFAKLQDIVEGALGGSRMVRRVLQPFMQATVITPAQWHVNQQHRPELLSVADAVRQHLRGRWTREQLTEELSRQGWSDDRIEAHINSQRKFFSPSDVRKFTERGKWDGVKGRQHLLDQGYDEATADEVLNLEGVKRIDQLETDEANAIIAAYVNRDIDDVTLQRALAQAVTVPTEVTLLTELAQLRRSMNIRRLSSGQVASLVMDQILAVVDFRRALEREGYPPEDVAALELQLRKRQNEARALEDLRRDQAEQRAAEQQQAAEERATRIEETKVAKAQPALAVVRRAYVRGHVPLERLVAALQFAHVGITTDDLNALVADAQQDRDEYLAAIAKRKEADATDLDADVPLARVEDAVRRGILQLDDYARELVRRGFDAEEQQLLVMLLRASLEDQQAATEERDAAARRAELKGVSLPAFERAVRLGLRTLAQYATFLDELGTPEVGKALAVDLLRAQLAQDADALAKRAASEAAAKVKNISLEQRRRAVLRGVRPRSYYEQALRDAGLPGDDQLVELALLDLELAEAEAARNRREQVARELSERQAREEAERLARDAAAAEPPPPPTLTLGQVERAVKLGLLTPDDLRDYLFARGYDEGDVELLVALVVSDLPDTRAGQQRREQISRELRAKGIALADFERGVRRGLRSIAQYQEILTGQGYGEDDVALLVVLLEDEVALDLDGLRGKIRKVFESAGDVPPLDELETAIASGELSPAQAQAFLTAIGVPRDTALVFVRILGSRAGEV